MIRLILTHYFPKRGPVVISLSLERLTDIPEGMKHGDNSVLV